MELVPVLQKFVEKRDKKCFLDLGLGGGSVRSKLESAKLSSIFSALVNLLEKRLNLGQTSVLTEVKPLVRL